MTLEDSSRPAERRGAATGTTPDRPPEVPSQEEPSKEGGLEDVERALEAEIRQALEGSAADVHARR